MNEKFFDRFMFTVVTTFLMAMAFALVSVGILAIRHW
jgi:predicted cobalt transporter CbtA